MECYVALLLDEEREREKEHTFILMDSPPRSHGWNERIK
jgi:hypothetical protein